MQKVVPVCVCIYFLAHFYTVRKRENGVCATATTTHTHSSSSSLSLILLVGGLYYAEHTDGFK